MKKILILATILFAVISCSERPDTNVYHRTEKTNNVYEVKVTSTSDSVTLLRVVVIDSCEYLIGGHYAASHGYGYMAHKGNCKYCEERRKREMKK